MNFSKPLLWLVMLRGLAPFIATATGLPADAQVKTILRERVEVAKKNPAIVVGILDEQGPRIIAYGQSGSKGGRALDGDTVFEIGSVTKVFTSLILADMVGREEVKLDDPISKYLPATVKVPSRNGRAITLVDLATHSSGLPSLPDNFTPADNANPYADYTFAQLYDFLSGYTLTRDIGAEYEYSNLGGGLLGNVLASRAGTNYEALVLDRICRPLGMTNTRIALTSKLQARLAPGHNEAGLPAANWDIPSLAGAGALRSTANDLLKLVAAAMGRTKTDLQPAFELSETPRHEAGSATMKIGLGWHIANNYGTEIVWHNGGTGGYRSFVGFKKKKQQGVVVLANSANSIDDIGFHLLESKYLLLELPKAHVAIKFDPAVFEASYAGDYEFQPGMALTVRRRDDGFYAMLTGQSFLQIFPETETDFFLTAVDAQLTFVKNAKGEINEVVLHQNGMDQTAKRVK